MKKKDIEQIVDDCLLNGSSPTPHTTAQLTLEDITNLHKTLSEGSSPKNFPKFEGVEPIFNKQSKKYPKRVGMYIPDTTPPPPIDTDSLFNLNRAVQRGVNIILDITTDTP